MWKRSRNHEPPIPWVSWVFEQTTPSQCRIFCCALWAIWGERNKRIHEKASRSGQFEKINFNAAYDGNLCQSAVWIVAKDSEGTVLLSYSEIHQQVVSAFAAEAIACRTATQIGIDMQWPKLIIEGDALSIINKCKVRSKDKSMVRAYIHDIQQLLAKTKICWFEHIPRTANSLAHILATETLKKKDEIYLIENVPEYAEHLNEREKEREPD